MRKHTCSIPIFFLSKQRARWKFLCLVCEFRIISFTSRAQLYLKKPTLRLRLLREWSLHNSPYSG